MAIRGLWNYARLALFSSEASDRQLFRLARKHRVCRIVEVGVTSLERTSQLADLACQTSPRTTIQYTGFDRFEERGSSLPPLSLIDAHRKLSTTKATIRLTPGSLSEGVASMANVLADTDLLLLSQLATRDILEPLWFYFPRMCHPGTVVLLQAPQSDPESGDRWEVLPTSEIERLAGLSTSRLAA